MKRLLAFIRRRKRLSLIIATLAVIVAGGAVYALWPPPVIGPPIRVVCSGWCGRSPGGGVTHTSAWACELDLERGRWRSVRISAARPQKMLSPDESVVLGKLRWKLWHRMDEEHYRRVRSAVQDWIASNPPARLNVLCDQGREDGARGRVVVTGPDFRLTTDLRRGGGFSPGNPRHKALNELRKALSPVSAF